MKANVQIRNHAASYGAVVSLVAGFGLIFLGTEMTGSNGDAISSIGQSLVAAALIGLLIETRAKERFAEAAGRNVFLTLFGRNAPRRYVEELERFCERDRIVVTSEWVVNFAWASEGLLEIRTNLQSEGMNIASRSIQGPREVWEVPSVGAAQSSFDFFELAVRSSDAGVDARETFDESRLTRHTVIQEDGSAILDLRKLSTIDIPPNSRYNLQLGLATYRRANDMIPLLTRVPTLQQRVVLTGTALKDLEFRLFHEDGFLTHAHEADHTRCDYIIGSVTFPGQSTILSWYEKSQV